MPRPIPQAPTSGRERAKSDIKNTGLLVAQIYAGKSDMAQLKS